MSAQRAPLSTTKMALILIMALAIGGILAILTMHDGTSNAAAPPQSVTATEQGGAVVTQTDVPRGDVYSEHGHAAAAKKAEAVVAKSTHKSVPRRASATNQPKPTTHGTGHLKVVGQDNIDGCDRAYGEADQCIPLRAPGNKAVNCAFLTKHKFFKKPLVVQADPLGLMTKPHVTMSTDSHGRMVVTGCSDS